MLPDEIIQIFFPVFEQEMQKTLNCCCPPDSANAKGETLVLTVAALNTSGAAAQ